MPAPKKRSSVLVTIEEAERQKMPQVLAKLRKAGLEVQQTIEESGFVQGMIAPEKVKALAKVKGVKRVRPELSFGLAPPESDVQ